jgi:hypothetical protein
MNWFPILVFGIAGLFCCGCEKHPLPGEPPIVATQKHYPAEREQHSGGKPAGPNELRDAAAQPSITASKPGGETAAPAAATPKPEAPKFFPEK